jgi:bifunctional non-homologous end joining protein LigD
MSLEKYKQKRHFDKTPEPVGGKSSDNKLHFVVQKHHASHLHYDFRLEMEGVLKSWAVPKGPSMNPADKRLAMMVEDHPWDYRNFEGIIPEGYGAGTVIVWDEGTYEPEEKKKTKEENEKSLLHHLYLGAISFVLHGHKLKGEFSLVKTKERGDNAWLLIKKKDKYASTEDITKKDKSVLSNKTLELVKANPEKEWESNRAKKVKPGKETATGENETFDEKEISALIKRGKKTNFLSEVEPMLCTLIREPFDDTDFLFEVKLDGYRIIAYVKKGKVTLSSRSGLDYTRRYPSVEEALSALDSDVVLDGELVALNEAGKPDFDALQKNNGKNPLVFYAFDILWYKGYRLMNLPLTERKEILANSINFNEVIKYSDDFEQGIQLFELMKKQDMEGIVAKRKNSKYEPGKRGKDWLKVPTEKRQEFVIGGWTESDRAAPFASLLFGYYENGKLIYRGHAGGGYKGKEKEKIIKKLEPIEIRKSPFSNKVDTDRKVHFVKPELVANIKFATYTSSGKIRKPAIFLGFREDKNPKQVVEEKPVPLDEVENQTNNVQAAENDASNEKIKVTEESNWKLIKNEKITSEDSVIIDGKKVVLTNIEKELWKGITKADLIEYYHSISSYILPYLKGRAESLHIKNIKATAPGFYIKDMEGNQPEWAETFAMPRKHPKKGKRNTIDYLVCNDEACLLYMINLGCIDINPWTSRIENYLQPDFVIIDLDPSDNDFKKVIKTSLAAKKIFDKLKLKTFPKTSGKTGMHLFISCEEFTFSEARNLAEDICKQINLLVPEITTTEITVSKRGDKLYIDPNQNDEGDTVAAAYSVRPAPVPTVSTPLEWKEINEELDPKKYDIHTILERIEKKGDLFKGVMDKKIRKANSRILKKLLKNR